MKQILICYGFSQIFELFPPFKWFIIYLQVVILSCILISTHDHAFSFLSFTSRPNSKLANNKASVFLDNMESIEKKVFGLLEHILNMDYEIVIKK